MANAICNKSGLVFNIQYFPHSFDDGTISHPIFTLPFEQLTSDAILSKWVNRQLTDIDTKLLFLAILHSSDLIQWHTYARPSVAVCEANMEPLIDILSWINTIQHPRLSMPHMAVTADTADLANVRNWIAAWNSAKEDFENGYKELTRNQLMLRKEDTLHRLIKSQQRDVSEYAGILADWATLSAEFPQFNVSVNGVNMPLAQYWKQILVTCSKTSAHIWRLNLADMVELLDHLETNLEHGSIYASATMELIRTGIDTHKNYLGYNIIAESAQVETANIQILADSAPSEEPKLINYPNRIAYIKDSIRWKHAQNLLATQGLNNIVAQAMIESGDIS